MGVNHVVFDGDTVIDLRDSTVTAATLALGATAYNAAGNKITGEMEAFTADFLEKERLFEILGIVEKTIEDYYEALEYIQSTGAQWIDTGFKPNQDTRLVMDAQFVGATNKSTLYTPFGARGGGYFFELYKASTGNWNLTYLWGSTHSQYFTIDYSARHSFEIDGNTATVDGTSLTYADTTFQMAYNIYLCATNNTNAAEAASPLKVYATQIYDNGTLVRDYVPRRRLIDGAVGMLDLVNEVFYESASGVAFVAPGELPSGYTRLEYIESGGTQYIDTGFYPNQDSCITVDMQGVYFDTTREVMFYGVGDSPYFEVGKASASWAMYAYYGSGAKKLSTWTQDSFINTRRTISHRGNVVEMDGTSYTLSQTTFSCSLTAYLFGVNMSNALAYAAPMKLYSCQIEDGGVLMRDYIPVKNTSGVAGLFDMVTMTFYPSASGTAFVAGPVAA